jgi:hypothetical protein
MSNKNIIHVKLKKLKINLPQNIVFNQFIPICIRDVINPEHSEVPVEEISYENETNI